MLRLAIGLAALVGAAGLNTPVHAQTTVDWPTYGFDVQRSSSNPNETVLGPTTVGNLVSEWSFDAGKFDEALVPSLHSTLGQIGGQSLVVTGVSINGTLTDLVLFGDANGVVFALNENPATSTGSVVWYNPLGNRIIAHGTTVKYVGVRSALTVDRTANGGRGAVYVPLNGVVHALDLLTGTELTGWPVSVLEPNPPVTDGAIHDAANLYNGQLYIGTAGYDDDFPPYFGRVASIDTATATLSGTWYTMSGTATMPAISGGGVWGWGGVAIDPSASVGGVYVATGNSKAGNGQLPFAEDLVNLTPSLTQVADATPAFGKSPNVYDNDYGSSPMLFAPSGCSQSFIAALNKTGQFVVDAIAADGSMSVAQTFQMSSGVGGDFLGSAAWDPVDRLVLVTSSAAGSAPFQAGLIAMQVSPDCSAPLLSLTWQTGEEAVAGTGVPAGAALSSPTYANGLAYFGAGGAKSYLFAVATASGNGYSAGQIMWQSRVIAGLANIAPTVVNGRVLASMQGPGHSVLAFKLPGH